jgi:DNA-binding MarR family transcriptional regulator
MNANPPYRFGNLLARARRSWIEQIAERMQEAGFPGYRRTDAAILGILLHGPLAIGQLGEALGVSRQAARQLADGLVERGYASFGTDDADARRTMPHAGCPEANCKGHLIGARRLTRQAP